MIHRLGSKDVAAIHRARTDEIVRLKTELMEARGLAKEAVNELCLRCGGYQWEHEGRCDGCRWKAVRCGDASADEGE